MTAPETPPAPLTPANLEEMKRRYVAYSKRNVIPESFDTGQFDEMARRIVERDFPRCLAEIERLQGEVARLAGGGQLTEADVTPDFSLKGLKPTKLEEY
jgi:hypothetical protein